MKNPPAPKRSKSNNVNSIVADLKRLGTKAGRDGMSRYGIPSDKAFGVSVANIRNMAKQLGKDHELAEQLWDTGWYETRMLAAFVDDPKGVTPAQMDRWCKDFDSWAICDTVCFHLFDRTPYAYKKVVQWASRRDEFVRRAAFALLASLALHDKSADEEFFAQTLPLIERAAVDERNFVKKGVSWALRGIGKRSPTLNAAALEIAKRLAVSPEPAARWVGKDALRDLSKRSKPRRSSVAG